MSDLMMIAVGLVGDRTLTEDVLNEVMAALASLPQARDANLDSIRKQLESTIGIVMDAGEGLTDGENLPWVEDIKAATEWTYWDSYVKHLRSSAFPAEVVRRLDEDTENILNECGNPALPGAWRIQGLVMGDVQSGKTASYCGLISKAADAGYRFIVLLTGTIEDLRSQTQERLDEGFVGVDSRELLNRRPAGRRFGAGRFRTKIPNVLTSTESDFLTRNREALGGIPLENISEPVLLVMKKNKVALDNLVAYLKSQTPMGAERLRIPMLMVDDEADNASVNARKDDSPATINRLIREVLDRFNQVSYVAYTATPFANVFINPDVQDLFPKNFVYSLSAPDNYIGATAMFADGGGHERQLVDITDAADVIPEKHRKDLELHALPQSLEDAIGTFLVSCAIRDLRGEPLRHRSMLVNVSRFTEVQQRLGELVKNLLYAMLEDIKQYSADDDLWGRRPSLVRLHRLFTEHYEDAGSDWADVRRTLYDATASVKVLTINQRTGQDGRLNYRAYRDTDKGRRVIAIGGQTLSRGMTLEGLCVSYFQRNSRAYDTLLQMGRWFGYRPRYADLCRIWMTPEAQDWFAHIADVVTELRGDISRMHANGLQPSQFGMRVKSHPGALLVTAANKMRNSLEVEIDLSFSGRATETPFLPKSSKVNTDNAAVASAFLTSLGRAERLGGRGDEGGRFLWRNVPAARVADFLGQMQIPPLNPVFIPDQTTGGVPIISFIREGQPEALGHWDVCLPQGKGDVAEEIVFTGPDGMPAQIRKRQRRFERSSGSSAAYLTVNKQRVGEIADEKVGLTEEQISEAEHAWRSTAGNAGTETVPGRAYRPYRQRPLLTIHAIEPVGAGAGSKAANRIRDLLDIEPRLLVAVSLVFPGYGEAERTSVRYVIGKVYMQQLGLFDDEGDDDGQD